MPPSQASAKRSMLHTILSARNANLRGSKEFTLERHAKVSLTGSKSTKKALEEKDMAYGMVKHWAEAHPYRDNPPEYDVKTLATHISALERHSWEALEIGRLPEDQLTQY